ncbi:MAG: response regulator transcription factor [Campylobacterales bacterium]|nr:response regulator transcription factor [Campylobacterales bacterium]
MAKILLVEDDLVLLETLSELLEAQGYELIVARAGNEALEKLYIDSVDLMLFDVNIPDFSGFELLQMLRDAGNTLPCIFLTSLNDIASLSQGFAVGADDYLKKPFDFDELLVRISALLRKSFSASSNELVYKDMHYKIASNELIDGSGERISFSPQEAKVLALLFKHMNEVVDKESLLFSLSSEGEASEGALRVYINKLRKSGLDIETQKGLGYRLVKA